MSLKPGQKVRIVLKEHVSGKVFFQAEGYVRRLDPSRTSRQDPLPPERSRLVMEYTKLPAPNGFDLCCDPKTLEVAIAPGGRFLGTITIL